MKSGKRVYKWWVRFNVSCRSRALRQLLYSASTAGFVVLCVNQMEAEKKCTLRVHDGEVDLKVAVTWGGVSHGVVPTKNSKKKNKKRNFKSAFS